MEALFQPVPFGDVRVSALEQISAPEHAPIWDMFRSIDPDKQAKVLLVSFQCRPPFKVQYHCGIASITFWRKVLLVSGSTLHRALPMLAAISVYHCGAAGTAPRVLCEEIAN
jgi:hypothetical protein